MTKNKILAICGILSFFLNLILIGALGLMQYNWEYNERVIIMKDVALDSCIVTIDDLIKSNEDLHNKFENLNNVSDYVISENRREYMDLIITCTEINAECKSLGGCN